MASTKQFILIIIILSAIVAWLAGRCLIEVRHKWAASDACNSLFYAFVFAKRDYKSRHGQLPPDVRNIVNEAEWINTVSHIPQWAYEMAMSNAYYICRTNACEFGMLYHKSNHSTEALVLFDLGYRGGDTSAVYNSHFTLDYVNGVFSGVVVHGDIQRFGKW